MSDLDPETFDADAFMNETVEAEGSSSYIPVPEGEYSAIIEKVEDPVARMSEKTGKAFVIMNITYKIEGQPVNQEMGLESVRVRQSLFLDLAGSSLDMSKGKNVPLNQIRAAVGQNTAQKWSPRMLEGQGPVLVKVKHRLDKDGNPQAEVKRVGTL